MMISLLVTGSWESATIARNGAVQAGYNDTADCERYMRSASPACRYAGIAGAMRNLQIGSRQKQTPELAPIVVKSVLASSMSHPIDAASSDARAHGAIAANDEDLSRSSE